LPQRPKTWSTDIGFYVVRITYDPDDAGPWIWLSNSRGIWWIPQDNTGTIDGGSVEKMRKTQGDSYGVWPLRTGISLRLLHHHVCVTGRHVPLGIEDHGEEDPSTQIGSGHTQ
jgi:hypothetical protein